MIDMEKYNKKVGGEGEKAAVKHLKKQGYKIIKTNFLVRGGEIDIIAEKDGYTVFVEVKTRTSEQYGNPVEAVGDIKQRRLLHAAQVYMMNNEVTDVRFDVIGVSCEVCGNKIKICEIQHIINAF
ncbi:MAG: YraN family protein [Clostridia bacterium]|nr:YraN family protein [Clostridia bacterium]